MFYIRKKAEKLRNPLAPISLVSSLRDISRSHVKPISGFHGLKGFKHFFYCSHDFWAPRWFLRAVKIATESLEGILSDSKIWSTGVDLLVNILSYIQIVYVKNASIHFLEKRCFWYLQGGVYENTIPHRYIVGNRSYTIPLNSPNVTGCSSKSETRFFRFFDFSSRNFQKWRSFWQKIEKSEKSCFWLGTASCNFRRV